MLERYSRPEMRELWTLENKFRVWLEVELAVTRAWHEMGVVPADALAEIEAKADFEVDRILEIEETTKHDVIAFLSAVEEKVGPNSRFIHLGCTSSDIVDTANGVLLTRAGAILAQGIDRLMTVLKDLAHKHKGLLCMGRTHGIHAEPTTYGLKFTGFYAEFARHKERFEAACENIRVGKLSGAVGTFAHSGPELEERACALLGLTPDPHSTQIVQRDRYAQYFTSLAMLAGGIERLGLELRHLQRTEVSEVEEGFSKGQKGSSAMPHKKNPISAENLCGLARVIRSNSLAAMENQALWHERDISHSSVERVIMPDTTALMDYMLHRMSGVLERLVVKADVIQRNLLSSFGLFYSQRVLNKLINAGLKRQEAYEMVQGVAMRCWENRIQFEEEVRKDAEVNKHLGSNELDEAFDPSYYKQYEDVVFTRVFEGK
ncbi:MAG: adenylosuccinate lyase [Pseudodesulfovibrio sp.]|uniref:Adenylosuccinate lyase n=1 Tax=Pseudodesulfovibrio indicus TaxID=1716143 RepID=A0A126QTA4_9BACT|nr:adenylosuccinate lyase [Pseudodesulfovibrio indicus]AMK12675.1 adenylosuccinate lyase [Pseudodesulfovibrio indicus]TDT90991.1 adenylosuccinate lyase [Pseudodesulfovibrio indicus]